MATRVSRSTVEDWAAGTRLGAVLHIEDAELQPMAVAFRAESAPGSADDLAPGEIVVTASVRVGFALVGA